MVQSAFTASDHDPSLSVCDTNRKLYITHELKDRQAKQGTSIKLVCTVTGFDPIFKWFKDGRPFSFDHKNYINLTKGVIGTIHFTNLTPLDAGEYKCVVQNKYGNVESKCELEILYNPDIPIVRPRIGVATDYYVYQFDELVFAARVDSKQKPHVTFFKNSEELSLNDGKHSMTIQENDTLYQLVIAHPTEEDSAVYTVRAKNEAGEDSSVHRIEFLGRESHKTLGDTKISLPSHRKRLKNPEEERLNLEFKQLLQKRDQIKSALAAKQEAELAEQKSDPSHKILTHAQRVEKEKLEIKNRITFEASLKDSIVTEGSTVKFVCSVTGPDPTFKWFKNDEPLELTKNMKNNSKLNVGALIISNVTSRDSGLFKCEVSNKHFAVESDAMLTVLEKEAIDGEIPTFTRAIREYYTVVSDDLVLEVRVRGNPKPKITWIKDCLDIQNEEYFAPGKFLCMREPDGVYKLAIHNPQRIDSGQYVCLADNGVGQVEIRHDVRVRPKEEYAHVHGINYLVDVKPKNPPKIEIKRRESKTKTGQLTSSAGLTQDNAVIEVGNPGPSKTDNTNQGSENPGNSSSSEVVSEEQSDQSVAPKIPKKPEVPDDPKFAINMMSTLRNQHVLSGNQVRLSCSVDGYRPEFKWYKDDEPIEYDSNVKNASKDTIGCLTIQKVSSTDAGVYKCAIYNRYCEISTSAQLNIMERPDEEGKPPMFTRHRHFYDAQIDQLVLEIQINGQPFSSMLWYKDCRDIKNNDYLLFAREPNGIYKIYIDKPQRRRDCGTYMVQVENQYGCETLKHEIDFWDKNDFVHANRVEHADPKNKWKKMETVPVQHPTLENKSEEGEVSETSHRRYRPFEMPPQLTRAERRKQQLKLEFITTLRNHTVLKGNNVKLSCCISDASKLKVTWLKDGEPFEKNNRIKESTSKEGYCTLEILRTEIEDSGVYECTAKTTLGQVSNTSKVTIYELDRSNPSDTPPVLSTTIMGES